MPVNYFLYEEFGFLWLFHRSVVFYAWQNPKNSSVFKKLKRSPENRHRGDGSISGLKNKVFKSDEIDPVLGGSFGSVGVIGYLRHKVAHAALTIEIRGEGDTQAVSTYIGR